MFVSSQLRFLLVYGLYGSKPLSRLLCHVSRYYYVNAVILLGDIVSPSTVKWLYEVCGIKVLGVLGRSDSVAVAATLSSINGFIECKSVNFKNVVVYGIGLSGCANVAEKKRVDIMVSSLPGLKYGCCSPCSDVVDYFVELLEPRIIITGFCRNPCNVNNVISPGNITLGYVGLLKIHEECYGFHIINILRDSFMGNRLHQ